MQTSNLNYRDICIKKIMEYGIFGGKIIGIRGITNHGPLIVPQTWLTLAGLCGRSRGVRFQGFHGTHPP